MARVRSSRTRAVSLRRQQPRSPPQASIQGLPRGRRAIPSRPPSTQCQRLLSRSQCGTAGILRCAPPRQSRAPDRAQRAQATRPPGDAPRLSRAAFRRRPPDAPRRREAVHPLAPPALAPPAHPPAPTCPLPSPLLIVMRWRSGARRWGRHHTRTRALPRRVPRGDRGRGARVRGVPAQLPRVGAPLPLR